MSGSFLGRYACSVTSALVPAERSGDTVLHSWEVLVKILQSEEAQGIICDIGM